MKYKNGLIFYHINLHIQIKYKYVHVISMARSNKSDRQDDMKHVDWIVDW